MSEEQEKPAVAKPTSLTPKNKPVTPKVKPKIGAQQKVTVPGIGAVRLVIH